MALEPLFIERWGEHSLDYPLVYDSIRAAMSLPLDLEEFQSELSQALDHTVANYNAGTIDRENHHSLDHTNYYPATYIVRQNPVEYAKVCKILANNSLEDHDPIWETYWEEWQHWDAAKREGFENPYFMLFFLQMPNGGLGVQQCVQMGEIPDGMDDAQFIKALRNCYAAPGQTSPGDDYVLDNTK